MVLFFYDSSYDGILSVHSYHNEIYAGESNIEWLRGEPPGTIRRMIRTPEWNMTLSYPEDPLYGLDGALFNLDDDPAETRNLFFDPKYRAEIIKLREQLIDWVKT